MNAPVSPTEILAAELALLQGVGFDLLCFHPYKAVLAFTHDLRVFVKTKTGRGLVQLVNSKEDRPVVGQDLTELHDGARQLVDDVAIMSDLPLLYSPGQIGLATMMVSNEQLCQHVKVDLMGYLQHRFADAPSKGNGLEEMKAKLQEICGMIKELREENKFASPDMAALKAVHKKLKKCRAWGSSSSDKSSKKKKKKRKAEDDDGQDGERGDSKRAKSEAK